MIRGYTARAEHFCFLIHFVLNLSAAHSISQINPMDSIFELALND